MTKNNSARVWATFILCLVSGLCSLNALAFDLFKDEIFDVTILDAYVDMHTGPGRGHPIAHVAEKGETITLLKKRTDWYKAKTAKGIVGWIKRDDLHATLGPDGPELVFSRPGREEYYNRKWELGVLGGTFEGARGLTTYAGYHLTPNIATEFKLTQAFGSFSNSKMAAVNVVHQAFPGWYVSPFFTLGTGVIDISPSSDLVQVEDRQDPILTVGAGVFVYVSRSFLLRIEYNEHKVLTTRENNEEVEEWKAGFSVFF